MLYDGGIWLCTEWKRQKMLREQDGGIAFGAGMTLPFRAWARCLTTVRRIFSPLREH
jgi:hypothetical protein